MTIGLDLASFRLDLTHLGRVMADVRFFRWTRLALFQSSAPRLLKCANSNGPDFFHHDPLKSETPRCSAALSVAAQFSETPSMHSDTHAWRLSACAKTISVQGKTLIP